MFIAILGAALALVVAVLALRWYRHQKKAAARARERREAFDKLAYLDKQLTAARHGDAKAKEWLWENCNQHAKGVVYFEGHYQPWYLRNYGDAALRIRLTKMIRKIMADSRYAIVEKGVRHQLEKIDTATDPVEQLKDRAGLYVALEQGGDKDIQHRLRNSFGVDREACRLAVETAAQSLYEQLCSKADDDRQSFLQLRELMAACQRNSDELHIAGVRLSYPLDWNEWVVRHIYNPWHGEFQGLGDLPHPGELRLRAEEALLDSSPVEIMVCLAYVNRADYSHSYMYRAELGDVLTEKLAQAAVLLAREGAVAAE